MQDKSRGKLVLSVDSKATIEGDIVALTLRKMHSSQVYTEAWIAKILLCQLYHVIRASEFLLHKFEPKMYD